MSWLFLVFLGCTLWQLLSWLLVFSRAFVPQPTDEKATLTSGKVGVSVILCFRNEASRLRKYVPLLLRQSYPKFELLAVDDGSTDGSNEVIQRLLPGASHLRLLSVPQPSRPGKKDALAFGIRHARYDVLLLTDADCAPASNEWITRMTEPFFSTSIPRSLQRSAKLKYPNHKEVAKPINVPGETEAIIAGHAIPSIDLVLGFSPYRQIPGTQSYFQGVETFYTAFQYLGFARAGLPYMGVGRNLAYRRSFFVGAGGLETHAHLAGGDDDLLVSQNARAATTAIVTAPEAWTWSEGAENWTDYWRRKFRHLSVGAHYPKGVAFLLALLAATHVGHYALGLVLLWSPYWFWVALGVLIRWLVITWVYGPKVPKKGKRFRPPGLLLADMGIVFYYLVLAPAPWWGGQAKGGWTT